jgi:serine/threonine-protein kinase
MNTHEEGPLEPAAWGHDVAERYDPVEPYYGLDLRPGHVLDGRFVLGEPISRSSMATVFAAKDTNDRHQTVVVKVPHLRCESDPAFYSRFQREEEIGRQLDHPYILKYIPVSVTRSRPYIVTEYVRGCTLAHLLNASRPLPEKDALSIASRVCEALQHMHERGVIHRDLKPGNIMICRDRTIRVLDFGIATSGASRRITVIGFAPMLGTPDYMAPEQVRSKPSDARTDLYCLGVILYQMLTGVIPFQNENPWTALNDRVTGDPVAPRKLNPALSPHVEEIVLHALQRNPDDRYPTATAMKTELDAPEQVSVTGYCDRLKTPSKWRLSLEGTPVLTGTLLALGFILLQVLAFLLLRHYLASR